MTDLPLVTIAIPTYNRVRYLKQALASAQAQTYPNLEIIVSDNASSDGTQAFMDEVVDKRVRYVRQSDNLGMVGNWNFCLRAATGIYFLVLSDDDLLDVSGIQTLIDLSLENLGSAFVYGKVKPFAESPEIVFPKFITPKPRESSDQIIQGFMTRGRPTFACGILFRLSPKSRSRGYNTEYKLLFDAEFWMNELIKPDSYAVYTLKIVGTYRVHYKNESLIAGNLVWEKESLHLLEYYLSFKTPKQLEIFSRRVRFRAMARVASESSQSRFERLKQVLQLAFQYRPTSELLVRYLARSLR